MKKKSKVNAKKKTTPKGKPLNSEHVDRAFANVMAKMTKKEIEFVFRSLMTAAKSIELSPAVALSLLVASAAHFEKRLEDALDATR